MMDEIPGEAPHGIPGGATDGVPGGVPAEACARALRLLPWATPDGRPCYLSTDGDGPVSALADSVEEIQLGIGEELLRRARAMHADPKVPDVEFRFLSRRLAEALSDALRVADGRARQ